MNNMILKSVPWCLLAIAVLMVVIFRVQSCKYKEMYDVSKSNEKAFIAQLDNAKDEVNVYKFSLEQMRYIQDSTMQCISKVLDSLKIKDKNVQQVQYMQTTIYKQDTIMVDDTIFLEPEFCLDTVVGDRWVSTSLHLEYPSIIGVAPSVNSEKVCIVNLKKETVNPPKKTWIGRLFQKKHKVVKVNIIESNPYMIDQENTFIEVVK